MIHKTTLMVNDDLSVVTLQRALLKQLGYRDVVTANEGFEVLYFMPEIQPDAEFFTFKYPASTAG
ncbi:MAG: hypothetical protein VYA34_13240 [Myxococcota bacterium]|nr:hypothetical protein [Myxococcota bacterium]